MNAWKRFHVCMVLGALSLWGSGCGSDPSSDKLASLMKGERFGGGTNLGSALPWPDGFDQRKVRKALAEDRPVYSPDGRYLAFNWRGASVLDLQTREIRTEEDDFPSPHPEGGTNVGFWVSNDCLLLAEFWQTDEERLPGGPEVPPLFKMGHAWRIVRIPDGSTILYAELGTAPVIGGPVGLLPGGRLLGMDADRWAGEYDLQQGVLLNHILRVEVPASSDVRVVQCPWLIMLRGVFPSPGQPVPHGAPVELEYVGFDTGGVTRIAEFPNVAMWGSILITSDGRWVFSAYYDEQRSGPAPVIVDSHTGQRLNLPAEESWIPVALSEARGVLLVLVMNDLGEDRWQSRWYEIPLNALLGG